MPAGCYVEPVDVPPQGEAVEVGFDVELAFGGFEVLRVLQVEPLLDELLGVAQPRREVVGRAAREFGEFGFVGEHVLPRVRDEGERVLECALRRLDVEDALEHRMDERAARRGRARRLG